MRFAKWVFLPAGVSGLLLVVPPYFLERQTGEDYPPPVTHPEYYYGYFGVTLGWQFLFLLIATDPVRYRRAILPATLEKAGRVAGAWLGFAATDATWLTLFVVAYRRTPKESPRDGKP